MRASSAAFPWALCLVLFEAAAAKPSLAASLSQATHRRTHHDLLLHRTRAFGIDHDLLLGLRGGGDVDDAPLELPSLDFTPENVLPLVGASLLAAFTIALVKNVPRSGGHAPAPIANFLGMVGISELASTGLFHLAYLLHCFVVIAILPESLKETIFNPTGVILLGTIFPLVESIRTAASSAAGIEKVTQTWLMYWIIHGVFSFAFNDMDSLIERFGPNGGKHWYAAIIYEMVTKPYIVPIVAPIAKVAEGWLTSLALTLINASHLWFVAFFFMALPTVLKRFAVMVTGTAYPIIATIVAVATENDGVADDKWLTYWSCFSLLYLGMIAAERFLGKVPGLYTLCLATTLYLMLPIFDGSTAVFRDILVPLFRQREALLVKDAKVLAKTMIRQLPTDRLPEASKAAAAAFMEETNKLNAAKATT